MRILLTNWAYNMLCGSQTFIYTILKTLWKHGHQPLIFTDHVDGEIAEKSREFAEISTRLEELRPWDVVWGSHQILRRVPNDAPRCQIVHAVVSLDQEEPIPGVEAHFAVSEETRDLIRSRGLLCHGIVRQPIDMDRFRFTRPTRRDWPPRLLFLGNYQVHRDMVWDVCGKNGIPFASVGGPTEDSGRRWDVAGEINKADIVVGQSRCVLEAMACERNAIVLSGWPDKGSYGLGGFVTVERYERWLADNLTGRVDSRPVTPEDFLAEVMQYNPFWGACLRQRILKDHDPETAIWPLANWTEEVTGKPFYQAEKKH